MVWFYWLQFRRTSQVMREIMRNSSTVGATSFPGSSLYLEKVPWLPMVTCLCIQIKSALGVDNWLNFVNTVYGGESCAAVISWKLSELFQRSCLTAASVFLSKLLWVWDVDWEGYWMVSLNLKVLAKFGLCSNCSQKLDEWSLARARKIFATARMLGFSLKFPYGKTYWETLRKNARAMNVSGSISWSFILVLLTFYWNWHK